MFASFILLSCFNDQKENISENENKIMSIAETKIIRRALGAYFNIGSNLENHDMVGELDTVSVKKIFYPKKTVFIYNEINESDTLTYHKDSLYILSAEKFYPLRERKFVVNNNEFYITKYYYEPRLTRPASTGVTGSYNIYLNDSLGIVLSQARSTYHAFREYNINYSELHKAIIRDTSFFEFEYPK